MKTIYTWFKTNSTHKCLSVFVLIGDVIFAIVVMIGWFLKLDNAVGMMNCAAMIAIVDISQYAGKSAVEHKWGIFSNPIVTSTLNGLASSDPTSGVAQVANAIQMQAQMQQCNNQISDSDETQEDVNDNSISASMGQENVQPVNQDNSQNQNTNNINGGNT